MKILRKWKLANEDDKERTILVILDLYYLSTLGLEISDWCYCGRNLWIFGYKFVIISRTGKRNKSMAWIDYKKTYEMVPHTSIINCLEKVGISEKI